MAHNSQIRPTKISRGHLSQKRRVSHSHARLQVLIRKRLILWKRTPERRPVRWLGSNKYRIFLRCWKPSISKKTPMTLSLMLYWSTWIQGKYHKMNWMSKRNRRLRKSDWRWIRISRLMIRKTVPIPPPPSIPSAETVVFPFPPPAISIFWWSRGMVHRFPSLVRSTKMCSQGR